MFALFALFLIAASPVFAEDQKIMIDVYYESLCPDSKAFVTKQLANTFGMPELQSYLNVSLIPYGKSKTEGSAPNYSFQCHHGENECMGNKYHACAIRKISEPKMLIPYINCLMMNTDKTNVNFADANMKCGKEVNITEETIESIKQCSTSEDGARYLAQFGISTDAFEKPLTSVPAVRVNGGKANNNARDDLKSAICAEITGTKPAICSAKSGSTTLSIITVIPLISALVVAKL